MNYSDILKNRLDAAESKEAIADFLGAQESIYISIKGDGAFPLLETLPYHYVDHQHIIALTGKSIFANKIKTGTAATGFIVVGERPKTSKKLYGNFICEALSAESELVTKLSESDDMVQKMLAHGVKFFKLNTEKVTVCLNLAEIYDIDNELGPIFAQYSPAGKRRYENSRHVLMTYTDRNVIFNCIVEDGVYYTLTKGDSNKIPYIKEGGICEIFDGKATHFATKIQILDEEKTQEIFKKLDDTNNSYFRNTEGVIALSFCK